MLIAVYLDCVIAPPGCDLIFNIRAARTQCQRVVIEQLKLSQPLQPTLDTDPATRNRYLRIQAGAGPLQVAYSATIELHHHVTEPTGIAEVPIAQLPLQALSYIYLTRYCQSDRLHRFAMHEFGPLRQGYERVQAIRDWVLSRTTFTSNSSTSDTSAIDTLLGTVGVCRDFAVLIRSVRDRNPDGLRALRHRA